MDVPDNDSLRRMAEQVADCLAERGHVFVEDDQLERLAEALRSFLMAGGFSMPAVTIS